MTTSTDIRDRSGLYRRLERLCLEPLRLTAALFGYWWTVNLIIGLFISSDFATSPISGNDVHIWFIPVGVNGWHVLVHGASGILGLLAASRQSWSAVYVGLFAMIYVAWGAAGLMTDGSLWIFYGDPFGNLVHLIEGAILGLVITAVAAVIQSRRPSQGSHIAPVPNQADPRRHG